MIKRSNESDTLLIRSLLKCRNTQIFFTNAKCPLQKFCTIFKKNSHSAFHCFFSVCCSKKLRTPCQTEKSFKFLPFSVSNSVYLHGTSLINNFAKYLAFLRCFFALVRKTFTCWKLRNHRKELISSLPWTSKKIVTVLQHVVIHELYWPDFFSSHLHSITKSFDLLLK